MFICGYHFPADMGNDVSFDKVIEKIDAAVGDTAGKIVTVTSETAKGEIIETLDIPAGTFAHKAFIDYFNSTEVLPNASEEKMIYFTNKYQISEVSKSVDGAVTKDLCKKLDDMNLYRVKVA
jgi:molybdenum cofactor biosynthesis enzyme MoaA